MLHAVAVSFEYSPGTRLLILNHDLIVIHIISEVFFYSSLALGVVNLLAWSRAIVKIGVV